VVDLHFGENLGGIKVASILNNSQRRYSLACKLGGEQHYLKVHPGLNSYGFFKMNELNGWVKNEGDFDDAVRELSKSEYVKSLEALGVMVLNYEPAVYPDAIPDAEPEPVRPKRKRSKGHSF
jgi:hypothetical protein